MVTMAALRRIVDLGLTGLVVRATDRIGEDSQNAAQQLTQAHLAAAVSSEMGKRSETVTSAQSHPEPRPTGGLPRKAAGNTGFQYKSLIAGEQ